MNDFILSQSEADKLLAVEKETLDKTHIKLPDLGGFSEMKFQSCCGKDIFVLNFTKCSIKLEKKNHNFRFAQNIGLVRLDLNGPPHRNPDGVEIGESHLHLYREGYGLKYACPVPMDKFHNLNDTLETLKDFMTYCNITKKPQLSNGLFL